MKALAIWLAMLAVALWSPGASADANNDEASAIAGRQALILLRVLAYDRDLATRNRQDEVVILVVHGASPDGRAERARWLAGFARLPNVKVAGRPVRAVALEYDARTFDRDVETKHPAAMIVGRELSPANAAIARVSRARRVLTCSLDEGAVRGGLAVGLIRGETGARDEIAINLEASRAEGVRFRAELLQLARLVEEHRP